MAELLAKALLAYLLGCLVGSLVIGAVRGVDIRTLGSGNAGATNALRTQGKAVGLTVLVIDLVKGWLATAILAHLTLPLIAPADAAMEAWSVPVCALAVMLGHIYPACFGFRGGKGVATLVGVLLGISGGLLRRVPFDLACRRGADGLRGPGLDIRARSAWRLRSRQVTLRRAGRS